MGRRRFSPQMVLNARVSFSRYLGEDRGDANAGISPRSWAFPHSLANALPGGAFFGSYSFSNYFNLGQYPTGNITNTGALAASVNWNFRGHSVKAGADLRNIQYVTQNFSTALALSADPGWTQQNYSQSDPLSGNSIASFLLGTPSGGSSAYSLLGVYKYGYYAPWVQDDWRVTTRLTLNLGLRWDFNLPPTERYDRMNRGFDGASANPVDQLINRQQFPGYPTVKGGLQFAGVNGQPRAAADTYMRAHPASIRSGLPADRKAGAARRLGPLLPQSEQQLHPERRLQHFHAAGKFARRRAYTHHESDQQSLSLGTAACPRAPPPVCSPMSGRV